MALRRPGGDPLLGRVFKDTYRINELLGQGGMGKVYSGEHLRLKKPIVIKVLGDELKGSEEFVAKFRKEAILQAMVNHPAAVQTIDLDEADDGTLYIVLEHAPGVPLEQLMAEEGRFSVDRATNIVTQVLEILSVAHEAKIVHRDLKPENILIEKRGEREMVRVLDFGIAVLLDSPDGHGRSRKVAGTPYYMAPEQAAGETVDGRADIYSLGVIYYQMITGELPLHDKILDLFFVKLLNEYPVKISESHPEIELPKPIEEAILHSLSKDPFNRFATASDMLGALAGGGAGKTRNFLLIAAASVLVAGIAIVFLLFRGETYASNDEEAAVQAKQSASQTHPQYAAAVQKWTEAQALKEAGDFAAAYRRFDEARTAFLECKAFDSTHQKAAESALAAAAAARPEHVLTKLGQEAAGEGAKLVAAGDYEAADAAFKRATAFLAYDLSIEQQAEAARTAASSSHPAYAVAEASFKDAVRVLQQRPLAVSDLDSAKRRFQEALAEFQKAVPYNDSVEKEAEAAKLASDPVNAQFQDHVKIMGDAVFAKSQGDYAKAYELFAKARDGFRSIAGQYDDAPEVAAGLARDKADKRHALFAQGQNALRDAAEAKGRGNYSLAYSKFAEASSLFARCVTYDTAFLEAARAAQAKADRSNPQYAQAEAALKAGTSKMDSGDYAGADSDFQNAARLFAVAKPYDSSAERAANRSRRGASAKIPVSFPAAEAAWARAEKARDAGDFEVAIREFETAEEQFKLAAFDDVVLVELAEARASANRSSTTYVSAEATDKQGEALFQRGNGPGAQEQFASAIRLYKQTLVGGPGPGPGPTGGGDEGPRNTDAEKAALAAAKRAKRDADEWHDKTTQWRKTDEINRQTLTFYEQATGIYEQGISAWKEKNYAASQAKFDEAVALFQKVSTAKR